MKVRKLAVALALAGGLGSGVAQALGLGEIELQSYLNEPLEADIGLTRSGGVSPTDVFVNLAPEEAYRQVGIDRNYFLTKLKFNVATAADGSLVVNVSTTEPVKEPYLNFLLEVTWPSGRLMREYSILIDPPVYAEGSGVAEPVQAPVSAPARATQSAPAPRQTVTAAKPEATSAPTTTTRSSGGDTFGPTGASDTLWSIASAVRPNNSVSNQQVMLAIQDLNPDAFIGGNINRLKRGQVLRIPSLDDIQSRTHTQATREVGLQNQALSTPTRTVDAREQAPAQQTAAAAGAEQPVGDELKLVVPDSGSETADGQSGSAGGDGQMPGGVDAGAAVAMEELESARRENVELSGRVDDLQSQVETLQRLLELKNSQLAELEQMASDEGAAQQQAVPAATAEESVPVTSESEEGATSAEAQMPAVEGMESMEGDEASATMPGESESMAEPADKEMAGSEVMAEGASAGGEPAQDEATTGASEQPAGMSAESPTPAAPAKAEPQSSVATPTTAPVEEQKEFPDNIIDAIVNNPLYQIALGGGLVLFLLLMLLIARRNANKEQAFYEQLNGEAEDDSETITLADEEGEAEEGVDALAEADTYIAYGRLDQAAQALEAAISREPSRTDLRLKLLGVYADSEDRGSFEKQFGELEALDDVEATAEANALRSRLEEAEAAPSIDELESQLMSGSFSTGSEEESSLESELPGEEEPGLAMDFGDLEFSTEEESPAAEPEEDVSAFSIEEPLEIEEPVSGEEPGEAAIEFDLSDVDLGEDIAETTDEGPVGLQEEALPGLELPEEDMSLDFDVESPAEDELATGDLELEMGDLGESLELEEELPESTEEASSLEQELESLDLGGESLEELSGEVENEELPGFESVEEELVSDTDGLDESFLDELDAELDKVAGTDEELVQEGDNGLEDLELDVSDEDLAMMGEVAEAAGEDIEDLSSPGLDEELGLEDTLGSMEEVPVAEEEIPVAEEPVSEQPVADQAPAEPVRTLTPEIDEAALGDEDDFDFLAGTDEAATKLDLARAYIEMGDSDGARDILEEVAIEGSDEQKAEAQDLLKSLS